MLKRAENTLRVTPLIWKSDDQFGKLLEILNANRGVCNDVMLFNQFTHSPKRPEILRRDAAVLKERLERLRENDFGAGINFLCSVGFFPENLACIPEGFQLLTGLDGAVNAGSFCHDNDHYRDDFLTPMLEILVGANPDFLWFDDDQRGHCACDSCIGKFSQWLGKTFTRDTLRDALNQKSPDAIALRRKFLEYSTDSLSRHYRFIERTVHRMNPRIQLGGMNIITIGWDLEDFTAWERELAGPAKLPVRWRPGGGTYTEERPDVCILHKAMLIAQNAADMPPSMTNRQSEIENFTYQLLKKSRHFTMLEACVYNACGMTGTAWNILGDSDDVACYRPMLVAAARIRPFLDEQVRAGQLEPLKGIWNGWIPQTRAVEGELPWTRYWSFPLNDPHDSELFAMGLPPAFNLENAEVTLLMGTSVQALDDAQIMAVLSHGVFCDVPALELLIERGFGKYLGFRPGRRFSADTRERLAAHPLNGAEAGRIRDGRQAFRHVDSWNLEPAAEGAEILADMIDYCDNVQAECCLGIYRNELGGRVAVSAYFPLREISFRCKTVQLKNLFNWLSGSTLTAWIESYHRIAVFAREKSVSIVPMLLDPAENAELRWRTASRAIRILDMHGNARSVKGNAMPDGSTQFILPELRPWTLYLITPESAD